MPAEVNADASVVQFAIQILSTFGIGGILVWYLWHDQTVYRPARDKAQADALMTQAENHRAEMVRAYDSWRLSRERADNRLDQMIALFRQDIAAERDAQRQMLKDMAEDRRLQRELMEKILEMKPK